MITISFRGKRFDGHWVCGFYYQSIDGEVFILEPVQTRAECVWNRVYPVTVGQYTGLQDKNGVEIYEGDILGGLLGGGVVAWVPSEARFGISLDDEIHEVYFEELTQSELEVIGNIHDLEEIGECVSQTLP